MLDRACTRTSLTVERRLAEGGRVKSDGCFRYYRFASRIEEYVMNYRPRNFLGVKSQSHSLKLPNESFDPTQETYTSVTLR